MNHTNRDYAMHFPSFPRGMRRFKALLDDPIVAAYCGPWCRPVATGSCEIIKNIPGGLFAPIYH